MKRLDQAIVIPHREIKLALMGGLTLDVWARGFCSVVSIIVFGVFAFYFMYNWRT